MAVSVQKKLLGYGPDGKAYYNVNGTFQDGNGNIVNPRDVPNNLVQANPVTPGTGTTPVPTIPGTDIPANSDRGNIETEAGRESKQIEDASNQAAALGNQSLSSLGDILQKQNQAQFNYDLPDIQENLQNSGLFTSPSALAAAVTRESSMLGANTQSQLAQAGLGNIQLQQQGILGANQNAIGLQQGGLQRQFSVSDYDKQAQLAKDIGAMSVPNAPSPFTGVGSGAASGALLGSAVPGIGTAGGAAGGAGLALLSNLTGGKNGGGGLSFLCTHLKKLGLMTEEEVDRVHDKIFTKSFRHFYSLAGYWILAPLFIIRVSLIDYPWESLKKELCDDVLACETSEEAFQKYKGTCLRIMRPVFPMLCTFIFGKEKKVKSYGY